MQTTHPKRSSTLLGVCDRSFRRYMQRYDESGMEGLLDRRLNEPSHRLAPVDEVIALQDLYSSRYEGWNVRHFHRWYQHEHDGSRSYSWVKNTLQHAGLVRKAKTRGPHRIKRLASALPGMMIHQDGSTHQWVEGKYWDLIVTMDDATNEHYSMRFVDEEGTHSSLLGVKMCLKLKAYFVHFTQTGAVITGIPPRQVARSISVIQHSLVWRSSAWALR